MPHQTTVRFGLCGSSFSISTMMIELDSSHGAIGVGTPVSITGGVSGGPVTYTWDGLVTKYNNVSGVQYALVQLTNTLNPNTTPPPPPPPGGGGPGGGSVSALSFTINITIFIPSISFVFNPPDPVDPFDIP